MVHSEFVYVKVRFTYIAPTFVYTAYSSAVVTDRAAFLPRLQILTCAAIQLHAALVCHLNGLCLMLTVTGFQLCWYASAKLKIN